MARKFRERTPRSTDRANTVRRANESSRSRPAPSRAPTRGPSPLLQRMQQLRGGGGAPARDPRQGAIDFGRQMTGGGGSTEQAVNNIRNKIMQSLAGRGIYQDQSGSYQIRGMERNDPSLAIRDMAVRGMGGSPWEQAVASADARLRQSGGTSGLPGGMNVPNGTSMADAIIAETNRRVSGQPMPPDVFPARGGVPQPGLGGVPPMRPPTPGGTVPQPGLGGVPPVRPPSTGGTVPQPGLGGVPPVRPPMVSNGNIEPGRGPLTPGGTVPQPGLGGVPTPIPVNRVPGGPQGSAMVSPGLGGVPSFQGSRQNFQADQIAPATITPSGPGSPGTVIRPQVPIAGLFGGDPNAPSFPGTRVLTLPQPGSEITPSAGIFGQNSVTVPAGTTRGVILGQMNQGLQARPGVPSPGLGGVPAIAAPPQNLSDPSRQPVPQPGLGGVMPPYHPGGSSTNQQGIAYAPPGGGVPSPGLGGVPATGPYAPPGGPPTGPIGLGGSPAPAPAPAGGFPPQGQGVGRTTTPTGSQVSPTQYPTTAPQPGLGGVMPAAPGRVTTPVVPPGALPGNTTPSRPGQMPTTFPNGQPFGTSGSPFGPDFPFGPGGFQARSAAGMPGGKDLSQLGSQIQQTVAARTAGIRGQAQAPITGPGQTATAGLAGLGDRIRASVMSAQGMAPGVPGVGTSPGVAAGPDLGGLGSSIMQRVQAQLQQQGVGQMPTMGQMPTPGGMPTGGITPGGIVPRGPAASPTSPMPTGTGQLSAMGGKYAGLDQYNGAFEAAGKEFGVPPELLKSMAGIESGWTGNMTCRPDDGYGGGPACGVMQVKGDLHQEAGCTDQMDPVCNIRTAAAILKGGYDACGNWDCAITSVYFTADDSNGTTQQDYLNVVHQSMAEQAAMPGGPPTQPGTQVLPTNGTGAPTINPDLGAVVTGAGTGGVYSPTDVGTGGAAVNAPPTDPTIHVASPSTAPAGPTDGNAIIQLASQGTNKPYALGYDATNGIPSTNVPIDQVQSWDCSGFTRYVTHKLGYTAVPVGSEAQMQVASDQHILKNDLSQIQPGDLVFMDSGWRGGGYCNQGGWGGKGTCGGCLNCASHVGIYIGNGHILAANTDGTNDELTLDSYPILGYASPGDYAQQSIYPTTNGYPGDV